MYIGLQDYVLMGWIKLYFAILKEDSKLLLTGDISRPKYHSIPCLQTEISTHNQKQYKAYITSVKGATPISIKGIISEYNIEILADI